MTTPNPNNAAALMGTLVADAAALGLHWIYDANRVAEAAGHAPAFTPINPAHYEGVPSYFAHEPRKDGDLSQYGEVLRLAMRSIQDNGGFDVNAYQDAYAAFFGAGGPYCGYIDRPTRAALANIATDTRSPSGSEDDQHPALATLPAVVAMYKDADDFHAQVARAVKVTNLGDTAERYSAIFADLLADVLSGTPLKDALKTAATQDELLQDALQTRVSDSTAYGEITRRACHLHQGMPLAFHILNHTDSYQGAVEANILAAGDTCGRALIVGSIAGAAYGIDAIPLDWLLRTNAAQDCWALAKKF